MSRKRILAFVNLSLVMLLASACSAPLSQTSPPATGKNVTFIIPIQVDAFSKDATLRVSLWNAEQLEASDNNAPCVVSYNAETGGEEVQCPDGVEYRQATPEELVIPIGDVGTSITVTSKGIQVGERYRVLISGLSHDDCNSSSASVDGTAQSETITLENLEWMTTLMACIEE